MATITPPQKLRPPRMRPVNGSVYTPPLLADYVAAKALHFLLLGQTASPGRPIRVLDPACGKGELLAAFWRAWQSNRAVRAQQWECDPLTSLCGVDIDKDAIRQTRRTLRELAPISANGAKSTILLRNALIPSRRDSLEEGWVRLKLSLDAPEGFDIAIANPPWGADISSFAEELERSSFRLLRGQFDTSDLFVELALRIVRPGGIIAFIIPDSLFADERRELRRLLITRTRLLYIARLGEGFFPNVFRGAAVVIARIQAAAPSGTVRCLRLTPPSRRALLAGEVDFGSVEARLAHDLPLSRFAHDRDSRFDIDTTPRDSTLVRKIESASGSIGDNLHAWRGVELSKRGRVVQCSECSNWSPLPSASTPTCKHCGRVLNLPAVHTTTIVSSTQRKGFLPLIVGESIRRYKILAPYYLDPRMNGIRYKDISAYSQPKIVIRKTGVGLTAALDYTGALTNQVVYILGDKANDSTGSLEVYLAILNSRLMYYYIIKRYGETEWRSHPYLTLKQIRELPVPHEMQTSIAESGRENPFGQLRRLLKAGRSVPPYLDAKIERVVAAYFGLTKSDYRRIFATLSSLQALRPVRTLLAISPEEIFP